MKHLQPFEVVEGQDFETRGLEVTSKISRGERNEEPERQTGLGKHITTASLI
jgi:hypothetical protein